MLLAVNEATEISILVVAKHWSRLRVSALTISLHSHTETRMLISFVRDSSSGSIESLNYQRDGAFDNPIL